MYSEKNCRGFITGKITVRVWVVFVCHLLLFRQLVCVYRDQGEDVEDLRMVWFCLCEAQ